MTQQTADDVLASAAQVAGLDARNVVVIRDGSNVMYRLSHGILARIGRQGTHDVAARQVEIARWLAGSGDSRGQGAR